MDNRKLIIKRSLIILSAVVLLTAILAVTVKIITMSGGNRLKGNANTNGPSISQNADVKINEKYVSDWQEDWVSLDGRVYEYNDEIRTFLILGIDNAHKGGDKKYDELTDGGQADGIYLLIIDPSDRSMKILAVNRDTDVDVLMVGIGDDGSDVTASAQISVQHAFGGGGKYSCELTRDAVSRLFYNIPIHAYMSINYKAVTAINDSLGGVTVTMPEDYSSINRAWTKGAEVTLKGKDAYDFVHERDIGVFESQRERLLRQKIYLKSLVTGLREKTHENITFPITLYNEIRDYTVTDLTVDTMGYMVSEYLDYSFGDGSVYTMEGYTELGSDGFEHFRPDEEALKHLVIELFYKEVVR